MKKAGSFIIVALLVISLLPIIISSVSAQNEVPGFGEGEVPLVNNIQAGQQQYEQFTTAENKSNYLKQEWVKLLDKNTILGPLIKFVNPIFVFLNPFFKIVLGYESSLSWAFVFAIIIWLILFFFISPVVSQLVNNKLGGIATSFAIVTLIGLSGVIKSAVDVLNTALTNRWIFWISLALAILFMFIFNKLGKAIKEKLVKMKKESEEVKTAEAQKLIQTAGKVAEKELKTGDSGLRS